MATHQLTPFAEQLRRYRRDRGLTQEELAEQANLSARGIRALELGERGAPHKDTVHLLAVALGLTPGQRVAFEQAASVAVSDTAQGGPAPPVGGFLGAVPVGPIIARQDEVSHLVGVLDEVTGGAGRLIMLAGEPGVGKTRLAQEVTVAARARDYLVATGRCYEPEQSVPYYPFLGALIAVYEAAPLSIRADVPKRWPYLEWLLPDRPQTAGASELGGQDVQQRLFWAISGFLQAVTAAAPVALLLDDLHWADESSLKLLQHVARESRASRVLLLGTYRDVEMGRPGTPWVSLERALRDLHREGLLNEMRIRRLEQWGTAALTAALLSEAEVSGEFAQLVHAQTDGNPFFTQEVMRALVERGDVFFHDGRWNRRAVEEIEVPRTVRSAIGERVSRLSEHTQEVLHEASVLGQTFDFSDIQTIGKRTEEELERALEEALGAMLVRVTGRDEYAFNHALTQQTLYGNLSPRRRSRLHVAIGEGLAELPEVTRRGRAAQITWHFLQGGDTERALPFALVAGDEAEAVFAHDEAEQHYRTAQELAHGVRDHRREAEAMQKLGVVLRILRRYQEALETLDRAAELYGQVGDHEGEARTMREIGWAHNYQGTLDQGITKLRAATERVEQLPGAAISPRASAELYMAQVICLWPSARYTEVLTAAERAREMARAANEAGTLCVAETLYGMALTMVGTLPAARHALQDAIRLFHDKAGDRWWLAQPWGNLGRTLMDGGHSQRGLDCLEESRTLIEAAHDQAEMAWIVSYIGEALYLRGDWSEARGAYDRAIQMARDAGSDRYLSYALLHRAELSSAEGDWKLAARDIGEGLEAASRCPAVPPVRKAQRLLAERDVMEGQPQSAIDRLQPLLDRAIGEWPRAFPPPVLPEAYLDLGDVAPALQLVLQRVKRFRAQNHRRALALWLRIQGIALAQQQRWAEAERVFAEAVSLAQAMPYPYAEGRALYEYGRLEVQRGEPEQARERLEEAQAIFRRLAARPDVERTARALAALDRLAGPAR